MAEVGGIAGEKLRSYIERIERLEAEKSALAADIREICLLYTSPSPRDS